MDSIFEKITQAINEFLISLIEGSLGTMFNDVNEKVGTIAAEVGKTPQQWNGSVFSIIQTLSENVVLPIAGLIITFVLCYELITMITEKNNMHDIDTFMFFKYMFKACVAVFIATHTFDIIMAVFDLGQYVVRQSAGVIGANTNIDISAALVDMRRINGYADDAGGNGYGRTCTLNAGNGACQPVYENSVGVYYRRHFRQND